MVHKWLFVTLLGMVMGVRLYASPLADTVYVNPLAQTQPYLLIPSTAIAVHDAAERIVIVNQTLTSDTLFLVHDRYRTVYTQLFQQNKAIYVDTTGLGHNPYLQYFPDFPYVSIIPLQKNAVYTLQLQRDDASGQAFKLYTRAGIYRYIYETRYRTGLQMLINTLSLGFLTFIFLFFLFYAIVAKQKLYTLYALYLFMALFFCLSMHNELPTHAQAWLYRLSFLRHLNETAVAWMFVFYIRFGDHLLGISQQSTALKKILRVTVYVLGAYGFFHLIKSVLPLPESAVQWSYVYFRALFLPLYLFILLLIILRVKGPLKPFLLLANFFLLLGVCLSVWVDFKQGVWFLGKHLILPGAVLQMGIVSETICFSFALGYYNQLIRQQRDERIRAQIDFEKRIQRLTMQSIEAQMNPHFLFNGINAVRDLVLKNKNAEALNYMNTFALLLRTSLLNSRQESISLADELTYIKHYLTIEKLRLGGDFTFSIQADPDVRLNEIEVPSQLLQPVVENAIKHGLRRSKQRERLIVVTIKKTADPSWHIDITDNGVGLQEAKKRQAEDPLKSTNLGLKLTYERLAMFNQQQQNRKITLTLTELITPEGKTLGTQARFQIHEWLTNSHPYGT